MTVPLWGIALALGDFVGVGVLDDPNEFCTDRGAVEDASPYIQNSNDCVGQAFGLAAVRCSTYLWRRYHQVSLPLKGKVPSVCEADEVFRKFTPLPMGCLQNSPPHPSRLRRATFPSRGRPSKWVIMCKISQMDRLPTHTRELKKKEKKGCKTRRNRVYYMCMRREPQKTRPLGYTGGPVLCDGAL